VQTYESREQRVQPKVNPRPEKIHALTSLRFFAALYVVFFHTLWRAAPWVTRENVAGHVLSLGFISVGFFFLLSGYILGVVYLRSEKPVRKRSFYAARFARIYPLFFITLIAGTPALLFERAVKYGWHSALTKTSITFLANMVMLQAWVPKFSGIDNPNWSLSVETLFYVAFPFIGVWLWRQKGLRLWIAALTIWVGSQAVVFVAYPRLPKYIVERNPLLHLGLFALGILLARWQTLDRAKHGSSPRSSLSVAVALLLALAGFLVFVFWEPRLPVAELADGLLAPLFICVIWACSNNRSLPAKLLSIPWLVILGEASYGLYLIHIPVYELFTAFHLEKIPAIYPLYLGSCIGLSVLSFYFVETPARKWLLQRFHTRPKETMEMASDAQ